MATLSSPSTKNAVVSTLNVLLLTLIKALPGGRPRITRYLLISISLQIRLNHASCSLYLFLYALVWMCVVHNAFIGILKHGAWVEMSSSFKLTWCQVWVMNLRVNILIVIGCMCGLTPVGIFKSKWVSHWVEFKWKGKPRFWINVAQHTHVCFCLLLYLAHFSFLGNIGGFKNICTKLLRITGVSDHRVGGGE